LHVARFDFSTQTLEIVMQMPLPVPVASDIDLFDMRSRGDQLALAIYDSRFFRVMQLDVDDLWARPHPTDASSPGIGPPVGAHKSGA